MYKKILLLKLGLILSCSSSAFAGIVEHALFQAYPGKSSIVSQRKGCGSLKERPYYHSIELYKEDGTERFTESIYISGITAPDLVLTGSWSEVKKNKILLSYDGDKNQGSTGGNTGWAALFGDIEQRLGEICRPVSVTLIPAATQLKSNTLKISKNGEKGKLKLGLVSKSDGGFTKPRPSKRQVSAQGSFQLNTRSY